MGSLPASAVFVNHLTQRGISPLGSSFRDPCGYVFEQNAVVKRLITPLGRAGYVHYMRSGLHEALVTRSLIVDHAEEPEETHPSGLVIVPEQIPFVSYPYEWCFDQLKDAALLTLEVQALALKHGMTLKDATAYNVQFLGCRPVFIDTLSFELDRGAPWVAYEQFCMHFLAPLLVMQYRSGDWGQYLRAALDGSPLDLVSAILPRRTYLRPGILMHLHLHARGRKRWSGGAPAGSAAQGIRARIAVLDSLRRTVESLSGPGRIQGWAGYYAEQKHYSQAARASKRAIVENAVRSTSARLVYDLGANTGEFTLAAAQTGARCVAFDSDAGCVGELYRHGRSNAESRVLPLVMDLRNPSPSLGFDHCERMSLSDRGEADLTMMLALVHHLHWGGRIPLASLARFLSKISRNLLLEFVPAADPMAQAYSSALDAEARGSNADTLAAEFSPYFRLLRSDPIAESERTMLLFERSS
jgi:hypothetical protein